MHLDFGIGVIIGRRGSATGFGEADRAQGVENTGNATIRRWELSAANPRGITAPVCVMSGMTANIRVPPESVVILSP